MKVPNSVTYDKIADGCDGMAGKLTDTERGMPLWMLMNPEIEELKRHGRAGEARGGAGEGDRPSRLGDSGSGRGGGGSAAGVHVRR